jgi:Protein of unknown function (DUF4058)
VPLRDHFHSPLDDIRSWDELHGMLPAVIVQQLTKTLPQPYYAAPGVYLGRYEVDIGTFETSPITSSALNEDPSSASGGRLGMLTYSPPLPTSILEPRLIGQDVYEVRIYDSKRSRRLVAAIEIVSPSNKDRPDSRAGFVHKATELLMQDVSVSILDIVTGSSFSLYQELLQSTDAIEVLQHEEFSPIYAVTMRMRIEKTRKLMDSWHYPLNIGSSLPTLPIWLDSQVAIGLDLESAYEEACQVLRIQ